MGTSDRDTMNFGEEHELNNRLRGNGLRQSKGNREVLIALGQETKQLLGVRVLANDAINKAIQANLGRFEKA